MEIPRLIFYITHNRELDWKEDEYGDVCWWADVKLLLEENARLKKDVKQYEDLSIKRLELADRISESN